MVPIDTIHGIGHMERELSNHGLHPDNRQAVMECRVLSRVLFDGAFVLYSIQYHKTRSAPRVPLPIIV